jgi:Na+-transporting NADH:ubiquinone oxidoreductase subunit NqrC
MLTIFFGIMIAALIIVLCPISSEEKDINRRRRILNEYNVAENGKKAHKVEKTNKWGDPVEEVKTGWDLFKN